MKTVLSALLLFSVMTSNSSSSIAEKNEGLKKVFFKNVNGETLSFEILNDKSVHFVYSKDVSDAATTPLFSTTPLITKNADEKTYQASYPGPDSAKFHQTPSSFETSILKISVEQPTLCFSVSSFASGETLTRLCPLGLSQSEQMEGVTLEKNQMRHLYGLGEQFLPSRFGNPDGDWMGQIRSPGNPTGNAMVGYPPHGAHGAVGNAQFPILYATDDKQLNYLLLIDEIHPITWDFTKPIWKIQFKDSNIKGFLTVADQLPKLREAYMDLVGHPLVPPKKAFGLWISQYGFDSWKEIDSKLSTLRKNHFPIDGFVMDLQWFGNVQANSENSRMGSLTFDESPDHFPNPKEKIASYKKDQGIGLITIEESYVAQGLKESKDLADREFLVTKTPSRGLPALRAEENSFYMNTNPWWGLGGMIDWTNPAAGKYWHQLKRQPLVDLGIVGHWTDLGEPEMYEHVEKNGDQKKLTTPFYFVGDQVQAQNIYSLKWHQSIFDGYKSSVSLQRPFILSRSGSSGSQRYGAGMWSGDIGSRIGDWATHLNVQMQMSLSGIDYFGADIGGFHREDLDGNLKDLYTKWFAGASLFDVPVRPHTENVKKLRETAPDRVGDLQSNLANIRLRYELSPYYYSLAHLAYQKGEPVVPPVFYYYPGAQALGGEKLIGRDLLAAAVTTYGTKTTDVYLPTGVWTDYHNLKEVSSVGQFLKKYSSVDHGTFQLPLFARAGAIIPKMEVDDQTMNILGKRADGVTHTEMIVRVFPSEQETEFTLFEDDGITTRYQRGQVARTTLSQQRTKNSYQVTIDATVGRYELEDPNTGKKGESPSSRQNQVELVIPNNQSTDHLAVSMNKKLLGRLDSFAEFVNAESGYFIKDKRIVLAKSGPTEVSLKKTFRFDF